MENKEGLTFTSEWEVDVRDDNRAIARKWLDEVRQNMERYMFLEEEKQAKDPYFSAVENFVRMVTETGTTIKSIERTPGKDGHYDVILCPPPSMVNFYLNAGMVLVNKNE